MPQPAHPDVAAPLSDGCAVCGASREQQLMIAVAGVLVAWTNLCHQHAQYFAAGGWAISLEKLV